MSAAGFCGIWRRSESMIWVLLAFCNFWFSTQTSDSFTQKRIHTTARAGSTPIHSIPHHPRTSNIVSYSTAATRYPSAQEPCSTLAIRPASEPASFPSPVRRRQATPPPCRYQQGTKHQQEQEGRRESCNEVACRIPQNGDHQRRSPPQPISHPPDGDCADEAHPHGQGAHQHDQRQSALNSLAMGTRRNRNTMKSNASRVHPSHVAIKA